MVSSERRTKLTTMHRRGEPYGWRLADTSLRLTGDACGPALLLPAQDAVTERCVVIVDEVQQIQDAPARSRTTPCRRRRPAARCAETRRTAGEARSQRLAVTLDQAGVLLHERGAHDVRTRRHRHADRQVGIGRPVDGLVLDGLPRRATRPGRDRHHPHRLAVEYEPADLVANLVEEDHAGGANPIRTNRRTGRARTSRRTETPPGRAWPRPCRQSRVATQQRTRKMFIHPFPGLAPRHTAFRSRVARTSRARRSS